MSIAQDDWKGAAQDAGNLSELSLTVGEMAQALEYARQAVDFADRSGDEFQRMSKRTALANALYQTGCLDEAGTAFAEAEAMQKEQQPKFPLLYSRRGFLYCDLLLSQGRYQAVQERAGQTIEIAKGNNWLLDIALDTLSLGRAYLAEAQQAAASVGATGRSPLREADRSLNRAVAGLREAGQQHELPRGLLARAELHIFKQAWSLARRDLAEAMELATRCGMRLFECDAHLEYARLFWAEAQGGKGAEGQGGEGTEGEDLLAQAREHVAKAKRLVEETGYHRRDGAVAELEERLKAERSA